MKKQFLNYTGYVIVILLLLTLTGLLNLFAMNFDWSVVGTVDYWVNTLTTTGLYFMAYSTGIGFGIDIKEDTDPKYKEVEESIHMSQSILSTEHFSDYVVELNYKAKKEAWISKWSAEKEILYTNQHHSVAEELALHKRNEDYKINRHARKFVKKRDFIEKFLSPQWIEDNLRYKKFKYPKITRQEIISGADGNKSKSSVLHKNIIARAVGGRTIQIFATTTLTAFYLAMVFSTADIGTQQIITTVITLTMVVFNLFNGFRRGNKAFKSEVMSNQTMRASIVFKYLEVYPTKESRAIKKETQKES